MKWGLRRYKNNKGQTAVEYILLLVVLVSLITSILSYVKRRYLGDPAKCAQAVNRNTLLCKIESYVRPTGGSKPFQYFPFKK